MLIDLVQISNEWSENYRYMDTGYKVNMILETTAN